MKKLNQIGLFLLIVLLVGSSISYAQTPADGARGFSPPPPDWPVGVQINTDEVADGYVLMALIQTKDILLVANDGRIVNKWTGDYYTGASAYLLENGNLLQTASLDDNFGFAHNGQFGFIAGRIEERTWDNEVVWSYEYASDEGITHHDIHLMDNGHILMIAFERFSSEEAIAAGFNPENLPETHDGEIWGEKILELDPETQEIVWEWRLWDHLIQDFDETKENYGVVEDHPELIDINYLDENGNLEPNWWHVNSVFYNEELDQIVISPRRNSEIWIIDHSPTTEEMRGEAGDLLYRWGNPRAYRAGTEEDRELFFQHDPKWIADGLEGAGRMMIYDNGGDARTWSRVVEIELPVDEDGNYIMNPGEPAGPAEVAWEYYAPEDEIFYSSLMSGSQRLPNGNTIISEGVYSHVFEINPAGEIVWSYNLPPATWVFRAERYNYPILTELDSGEDHGFAGGNIWGVACMDGTQPRLYQYNVLQFRGPMLEYMDLYGEEAQAKWEIEACVDFGGISNSAEDGRVWGQDCADGTQPRLHRGIKDDAESMQLFIDSYGEEEAQLKWETEACAEHDGLAG